MDPSLALFLGLLGGALSVALYFFARSSRTAAETSRLTTERDQALEAKAEAQAQIDSLRVELSSAQTENAKFTAQLEEREVAHQAQLTELKNLRENLQDTFRSLSSKALQSNNEQFLSLAEEKLGKFQKGAQGDLAKRQEAINTLVKPLAESLKTIDGKIGDIEKARTGAYASLKEQIHSLGQTQTQLQTETANLVKALRTPNVRGQWGEVQLKRTVEFAGMVDHVDFVEQENATTDEGRLRPDLIVRLPNGGQVIVDAKTPLDGYLKALEAPDPETRKKELTRHARQIRDHIKKLGSKNYWKEFEPTPEFVVLFIPGEAFFSAALEEDPSLIEMGTADNVILATPTTLIALLKAVAFGWRQEQIAEQAQAISDLGKDLYERIVTLGGHFDKMGNTLGKSVDHYNAAMRSLDTRVLVTARKFIDLAPLSSKELPTLKPIEQNPNTSSLPKLEEDS
jgi:DNA recombination protein RmuC|tara:strand:- start:2919 stop:4283 length:1365 start_codon:yes stop_codon:yes gene_type:complete